MIPLLPGRTYHIYNHSNGDDLLFREGKNYIFFLEKYRKYIAPVADTFAYCLMPNHFHVLLRIKEPEEIVAAFHVRSYDKYIGLTTGKEKEEFISLFASKQFSNLFSSYTQSFNKVYERRGSLFIKNFKRKQVEDEAYLKKLVNYIHFNPVRHGFVLKPEKWDFSSYKIILSDKPTWLNREEVIAWYDDMTNFKYSHRKETGLGDI